MGAAMRSMTPRAARRAGLPRCVTIAGECPRCGQQYEATFRTYRDDPEALRDYRALVEAVHCVVEHNRNPAAARRAKRRK
jgi:hypothetical protein